MWSCRSARGPDLTISTSGRAGYPEAIGRYLRARSRPQIPAHEALAPQTGNGWMPSRSVPTAATNRHQGSSCASSTWHRDHRVTSRPNRVCNRLDQPRCVVDEETSAGITVRSSTDSLGEGVRVAVPFSSCDRHTTTPRRSSASTRRAPGRARSDGLQDFLQERLPFDSPERPRLSRESSEHIYSTRCGRPPSSPSVRPHPPTKTTARGRPVQFEGGAATGTTGRE